MNQNKVENLSKELENLSKKKKKTKKNSRYKEGPNENFRMEKPSELKSSLDGLIRRMEEEINALEERKTEMPNLSNRGKTHLKEREREIERERESELHGPTMEDLTFMSLELWKKRAVVKKHSKK